MNTAKTGTLDKSRTKSHLEDVGETYFEHFGHAVSFSWCMFKTGFAVLIHAVFPETFKTTGSDAVNRLYDCMVKNRRTLSK